LPRFFGGAAIFEKHLIMQEPLDFDHTNKKPDNGDSSFGKSLMALGFLVAALCGVCIIPDPPFIKTVYVVILIGFSFACILGSLFFKWK
jgi:hypothetical protein